MESWRVWAVILAVGAGTYAMRVSFLGFLGRRSLPEWALRHLRYTAVAVLPALVAPLVVWPKATGGALDTPRLMAAAATVIVGVFSRNTLAAILAGGVTLYSLLWLL